jgi:hypothetical protein
MSQRAVDAAEKKVEQFLTDLDRDLGPGRATKAEYKEVFENLIEEAKIRLQALGPTEDEEEG